MADSTVAGAVGKSGDDGRLPVLIGVSGQRFFDKSSLAAHLRLSRSVEQRLGRCFEQLDEDFPTTPKVLVTGGALGTDLLAAALARRRNWQVALLLAFDGRLFLEDFEPPEAGGTGPDREGWSAYCAAAAEEFRNLVGNPSRGVIVKTLPPLAGPNGEPASDGLLSRTSASRDSGLRREHYEQVGQWIAEAATVLVAVTSEPLTPSTEANGGTVRVIAHRRLGRPIDQAGLSVAERSSVLRRTFPTALPPPGRSAWLIDPRGEADDRLYEVTALEASEEAFPSTDVRRGEADTSAHAGVRSSLALARGFERLNDRVRTASTQPLSDDPLAAMAQIRATIGPFTASAKERSQAAFRALALAFVAAVLLFEVYAKFFSPDPKVLGIYLMILVVIGLVSLLGRRRRWQPISEDYRAVSEMLRVQRAWWAIGLPNRVDREHLQGVDGDLARVRDAVTTIVAWIWLRSPWTLGTPTGADGRPLAQWKDVRQGEREPRGIAELVTSNAPADWIGGQIRYFANNRDVRERSAHTAERLSWFLFITGGLLAALLCGWLASHAIEQWLEPTVEQLFKTATNLLQRASAPIGMAVFLAMSWLRNLAKSVHGVRGFWLSVLLALPAAIGLMLAAIGLGEMAAPYMEPRTPCPCPQSEATAAAAHAVPDVAHDAGKNIAIITIVVLNAVAGAWRFLAEKLGWEAEALAFRDAAAAYMTAEASLAADWDENGRPRDPDKARSIVLALGHVALRENEAWLKMRRERPLTPVSG